MRRILCAVPTLCVAIFVFSQSATSPVRFEITVTRLFITGAAVTTETPDHL
jgi:hypothetical protein